MALVLKLTKGIFTSNYVNFSDETGSYNISTNIGGYGSPNPERSILYLGLVACQKHSEGNILLDVAVTVPTSADPTTVTGWKVTTGSSGWFKFAMFIAPLYDEASTYAKYDIVWEPNKGKFYYYSNSETSIAGAFSETNGWTVVSDPELVDKCTLGEDAGFYKTVINDFITQSVDVCFAKKSLDFTKSEDCKSEHKCLENFKIFTYKVAAQSLAAVGNFTKGEDIIEKVEEMCGSGSSSCGCK